MPTFDSQFALSLEITRVIGAAVQVVPPALKRFFNDAKELKKSGSDIVLEEDLATIFRQMRIDPTFENKFKTEVAKNAAREPVVLSPLLPISLFSGGPTVLRALQRPEYLPMIIQLSLLCSSHDLQSLAEGLEEALRLRSNDPKTSASTMYDSNALLGVLVACSEQTSSFLWISLFEEVNRQLGLPRYFQGRLDGNESLLKGYYYALTVPMLQASLDMFAAIQRFEDEHYIVVDSAKGVSTIVVWAYYVLGLTVQVNGCPQGSCVFGNGRISVIINLPSTMESRSSSALYLMDVSDEVKLKIGSEDDQMLTDIAAELKIPAFGYVKRTFELDRLDLRPGAIHELTLFTGGLALLIASKCRDLQNVEPGTGGLPSEKSIIRESLVAEPRNLRRAIDFLIGPGYSNRSETEKYADALRGKKVKQIQPLASLGYLKDEIPQDEWPRLRHLSCWLVAVILAFAAVGDLETCKGIMLRDVSPLITTRKTRPYNIEVESWDGERLIWVIGHDEWYRIMATLLPGKSGVKMDDISGLIHYQRSCLSSGYGWSVFLDSLWDKDPITVRPGRIWIQRGVPYKDGSYARTIHDGPETVQANCPEFKVKERFNDEFRSRCEIDIDPAQYMVALRNDSFHVSRRLRIGGRSKFCCLGYAEMALLRFVGYSIPSCEHSGENFDKLNLGMATLEGFGWRDYGRNPPFERLNLLLTSDNSDARWLGLLGAVRLNKVKDDDPSTHTMIKGPDTCMSCCVQYATAEARRTFLIL